MLPSLFASEGVARAWSVPRAVAFGAGVGVVAALFKTNGPLHESASTSTRVMEIAGVAVAFGLLCAGAAVLRNLVARRLIWPNAK